MAEVSCSEDKVVLVMIKVLLSSKHQLFMGIKLMMHIICVGALKFGVGSMVSQYEYMFPAAQKALHQTRWK